MSYSVDTSNIFAVLSGGNAEVKATKPVDDTPATTGAARDSSRRGNGRGGRGNNNGGGRGGSRGGRGGNRSGGNASNAATTNSSTDLTSRPDNRDRRGGGRGRRDRNEKRGGAAGAVGAATGGAGGRNRRQHDRHSGTKLGHVVEKRGGAGQNNWGRPGDETIPAPTTHAEDLEGLSVADAKVETEEVHEPENDGTMSLEEYEQKKAANRAKIGLPEPRKAGEGEDSTRWNNLEKLVKDDVNDPSASANGVKKERKKKDVVPLQKVFRVQEPKANNNNGKYKNERGGRGGGRGNSNSNGNSNSAKRNNVQFTLTDDSAFPSLAGK